MSAASPRQRTVRGDGLDLAVYEWGDPSAPTIVCVHGYPDCHHVWDGVAAALADRYHVVTFDVRGAGHSGVPTDQEGYDLVRLSADIGAVIDAVSPDSPVHLVGHDWGSIQAWEAVTDGTHDGRIVSYTTMSGPALDHVGRFIQRHTLTLDPARLRAGLRQTVHSWYVGFFQLPVVPEFLLRTFGRRGFGRYLERIEKVPGPMPDTFTADAIRGVQLYRRNMPRRIPRPRHGHTDIPVQLIVPDGDPYVTPPLVGETPHFAPNLLRRDVPGRHWLPAAHPDRFARWVSEFVDAVEAGAPLPHRDEVVVVTGAGGGIGRETSLAFAARGAHVICADRDQDAAGRTAELCRLVGGTGSPFTVDVSDPSAMEVFAKQVLADVGTPDVVVANAGIGMAGGILDTGVGDWEDILGVNLMGVVHTHRLFAPAMIDRGEGGHLVTVASAAAYMPQKAMGAYATTKAAAYMFNECLRAEVAAAGLGVSTICPGIVDTGIISATRFVGLSAEEAEARRRATNKAYRRRGFTPDRVAAAIVRAVDDDVDVVPVAAEARVGKFLTRFAPGLVRAYARTEITPR